MSQQFFQTINQTNTQKKSTSSSYFKYSTYEFFSKNLKNKFDPIQRIYRELLHRLKDWNDIGSQHGTRVFSRALNKMGNPILAALLFFPTVSVGASFIINMLPDNRPIIALTNSFHFNKELSRMRVEDDFLKNTVSEFGDGIRLGSPIEYQLFYFRSLFSSGGNISFNQLKERDFVGATDLRLNKTIPTYFSNIPSFARIVLMRVMRELGQNEINISDKDNVQPVILSELVKYWKEDCHFDAKLYHYKYYNPCAYDYVKLLEQDKDTRPPPTFGNEEEALLPFESYKHINPSGKTVRGKLQGDPANFIDDETFKKQQDEYIHKIVDFSKFYYPNQYLFHHVDTGFYINTDNGSNLSPQWYEQVKLNRIYDRSLSTDAAGTVDVAESIAQTGYAYVSQLVDSKLMHRLHDKFVEIRKSGPNDAEFYNRYAENEGRTTRSSLLVAAIKKHSSVVHYIKTFPNQFDLYLKGYSLYEDMFYSVHGYLLPIVQELFSESIFHKQNKLHDETDLLEIETFLNKYHIPNIFAKYVVTLVTGYEKMTNSECESTRNRYRALGNRPTAYRKSTRQNTLPEEIPGWFEASFNRKRIVVGEIKVILREPLCAPSFLHTTNTVATNSVMVYIPLQDVPVECGGISVVPSRKQRVLNRYSHFWYKKPTAQNLSSDDGCIIDIDEPRTLYPRAKMYYNLIKGMFLYRGGLLNTHKFNCLDGVFRKGDALFVRGDSLHRFEKNFSGFENTMFLCIRYDLVDELPVSSPNYILNYSGRFLDYITRVCGGHNA